MVSRKYTFAKRNNEGNKATAYSHLKVVTKQCDGITTKNGTRARREPQRSRLALVRYIV